MSKSSSQKKRSPREEARRKVRLNDKEKLLYEQQLVREGKIYPRAHYMPRGRFRGILAVVLAFFFGIFLAFGGTIGAGVYLGTSYTIDQVLQLFNLDPETYNQYIGEEYSKLTVLDLVTEMLGAKYESIGDISKYSPFLDSKIEELIGLAGGYGVTIDKEKLLASPFAELGNYFQNDVLHSIVIGKVAGLEQGNNAILIALCYGEEGTDFTYNEDGSIEVLNPEKTLTVGKLIGGDSFDEVLHTVRLGTLLNLSSGITEETFSERAILFALAYGKRGVDYEIDESGKVVVLNEESAVTVGDLMNSPNAIIEGIELGTLLGIDSGVTDENFAERAVLFALAYGKRGTDYEIDENGNVSMLDGKAAVTVGDLMNGPDTVIRGVELGALLGIDSGVTDENFAERSVLFALAYGKRGTDYEIDASGNVSMLEGKTAVTVGDLMDNPNAVIDGVELGALLGIDTGVTDEKLEQSGMMYALCYGVRGTDYTVEDGKIVMLEGHDPAYPTTVGALTSNSNGIIQGLEIETLLGVKPNSEKALHYLAYGPEMATDEAGNYLMDEDGNYLVEEIVGEDGLPTGKYQYAGGGRYVYERDGEGNITGVRMLPDPNDPDGALYTKRKVKDLTEGDSDLLGGAKIGDFIAVGADASALMRTLKDWTIADLQDESKLESLTIGQLIEVEEGEGSSKILQALKGKTLAELKQQETIESLKLGDILDINDESSAIMVQLKDKTLADLKDQETFQATIDKLTLGELLGTDEKTSSAIMRALSDKTVADLKKQETIDNLTLKDILDIDDTSSSGILTAMKDWKVKDLNNQNRINRLRIGQLLNVDEDSSSKLMYSMRNWRIGDLTDQKKIDSLTLSDVIEVGDSGILAALGSTPIGEMQTRIDSLRLSEILDKDELEDEDNLLLKHLKDSTLTTLAHDVKNLTIGQVFADQVYSYMEVVTEGGTRKDYDWYRDQYFGKIDEAIDPDAGDLQFNYQLEKYNKDDYRPKAVALGGQPVTTHYVTEKDGKAVERTYSLTQTSYTALPEDSTVHYDPVIAMNNDKNGTAETPYYIEQSHDLQPVYAYYAYDYEKGGVTGEAYTGERETDAFGDFYKKDGERIDLEPVLTGYEYGTDRYDLNDDGTITYNGKPYTVSAAHKLVIRTPVYEMYVTTEGNNIVDSANVAGRYSYEKDGKSVELSRYLSGVWYLLLTGEGETDPMETSILDVGDLISQVNTVMQKSTFAELWFHGILEANPYANLVFTVPYVDLGLSKGVRIENSIAGGSYTARNLIEVRLGDTVALIKAFTDALNNLNTFSPPFGG